MMRDSVCVCVGSALSSEVEVILRQMKAMRARREGEKEMKEKARERERESRIARCVQG